MAQHTVSVRLYVMVFLALLVLAGVTTAVAFVNLGIFNTALALLIAGVKTVLVVLFFMHVRWASRLTWVFVIAGFCWLAVLMGLAASDYISRYWLPVSAGLPR